MSSSQRFFSIMPLYAGLTRSGNQSMYKCVIWLEIKSKPWIMFLASRASEGKEVTPCNWSSAPAPAKA